MALNEPFYETSPQKTPIVKESVVASCSYDTFKEPSPQCTILMDEFGQTPDHYYLAKRAPPTFYQVRRKLNLQTFDSSEKESSNAVPKRKYKKGNAPKKGKTAKEKARYDTSLGQLTKKFLTLLANASDGVINLNNACEALDVPKRRLYDITNVLEGAGLIQKTARNSIQWKGTESSPFTTVRKYELEKEIEDLEAKENKLDELIDQMKQEVKSVREEYKEYNYVTADDLKNIKEFSQEMVIGINLSSGNQVIETKDNTVTVTDKNHEVEASLLSSDELIKLEAPTYMIEEFQGNYAIKIVNRSLLVTSAASVKPKPDETLADFFRPQRILCGSPSNSNILSGTMWPECFEDDPDLRNAFIRDYEVIDDDLQDEDQGFDDNLPFPILDDYSYSLDYGEGLTDLFECDSNNYEFY